MSEKTLITADEAAERLSICRKTLYAHTSPRGTLPCAMVGRAVRYRPADLDAWVAGLVSVASQG